jgi:hypothetical protein
MTISYTSISTAYILVKLNSMKTNTCMSIAHILVKLNNMNRCTSISIARILLRLNSMNNDIGSLCTFVCRAGGGDTVVDCSTKSSMSIGGRVRSNWRRICQNVAPLDLDDDDPSWKLRAVTRRAFLKNLIRPLPVQDRTRILETCSPDHRCVCYVQ